MLVSTGARRTSRQRPSAAPSSRAFAWSSARRGTSVSSATSPAAARTPAWRIPPPRSLRTRRASSMRSRVEAKSEPTGAHSPFERHVITVSTPSVSVARRHAERHGCVPDARSVEVDPEAALPGGGDHGAEPRDILHRAAAEVVAVLEHDQRHVGGVVPPRRHGRAHVVGREMAARRVDHARHHPGDLGHSRELVAAHVAAALGQHLVAAPGQEPDRDLVAHRARRDEERRLHPQELGRALFQPVDGRILAVDVVADLGLRHGLAHLRGRLGDGVGAQVDGGHGRRTVSLFRAAARRRMMASRSAR